MPREGIRAVAGEFEQQVEKMILKVFTKDNNDVNIYFNRLGIIFDLGCIPT